MHRDALPLPRYHRIYLVLREQLAEGGFPPGAPLPGELELAQRYRVSRVTVRAALGRLAREKLIVRQRGRGTFPRPRHAAGASRARLGGLLENLLAMGLKTTVRVVELAEIAAPPEVAQALRIPAGDRVQKAVRLRSYRGAPVSHLTTFVPAAIAARFGRRELAAKPMLQLLEESGVRVSRAEQTLSARLADHAVAPLLEVGIGSPLLAVTRTVYDQRDRPVQLLRGLYPPERFEYRMDLTRSGGDTPRIWISDHRSTSNPTQGDRP
jgi:GntR family transcriptional regulator